MAKTRKQPVRQRIIDIATWGVFFLIASLLYGELIILKFTIPLFLLISTILATGRYKPAKSDEIDPAAFWDSRRPFHSGYKTLASRQASRGY
jgi:hypothetical protein